MLNLSPLEIKSIKRDLKQLFSQTTVSISCYEESGWEPGYNESNSQWGTFQEYAGFFKEIDKFNIERYDFGDVEEGDIVVILPADTFLPESSKYKIDYQGFEYISKTDLFPRTSLGEVLYYVLIGSR